MMMMKTEESEVGKCCSHFPPLDDSRSQSLTGMRCENNSHTEGLQEAEVLPLGTQRWSHLRPGVGTIQNLLISVPNLYLGLYTSIFDTVFDTRCVQIQFEQQTKIPRLHFPVDSKQDFLQIHSKIWTSLLRKLPPQPNSG